MKPVLPDISLVNNNINPVKKVMNKSTAAANKTGQR